MRLPGAGCLGLELPLVDTLSVRRCWCLQHKSTLVCRCCQFSRRSAPCSCLRGTSLRSRCAAGGEERRLPGCSQCCCIWWWWCPAGGGASWLRGSRKTLCLQPLRNACSVCVPVPLPCRSRPSWPSGPSGSRWTRLWRRARRCVCPIWSCGHQCRCCFCKQESAQCGMQASAAQLPWGGQDV